MIEDQEGGGGVSVTLGRFAVSQETRPMVRTATSDPVETLRRDWRAAGVLSAGQVHVRVNAHPLEPLTGDPWKPRPLGPWATAARADPGGITPAASVRSLAPRPDAGRLTPSLRPPPHPGP